MRKFWFMLMLSLLLVLVGCLDKEQNNEIDPDQSQNVEQDNEQDSEENETEIKSENDEQGDLEQKDEDKGGNDTGKEKINDPSIVADMLVLALAEKDMETLADFVHPSKGVRFSPYGYVYINEHLVFTDLEVKELMDDNTVYNWGAFDGTGDPIEMTFAEYYDRFVYDEDYLNAEEQSVDERIGQGNTLDNIDDVYPDGTVVEYHFSGFDPQYDGMDWRSLRIVLKQEAGQWYLVGIIHDEWTI